MENKSTISSFIVFCNLFLFKATSADNCGNKLQEQFCKIDETEAQHLFTLGEMMVIIFQLKQPVVVYW